MCGTRDGRDLHPREALGVRTGPSRVGSPELRVTQMYQCTEGDRVLSGVLDVTPDP